MQGIGFVVPFKPLQGTWCVAAPINFRMDVPTTAATTIQHIRVGGELSACDGTWIHIRNNEKSFVFLVA